MTAFSIANVVCEEFDTFLGYWYTCTRVLVSMAVKEMIQNSGRAESFLQFIFGWITIEDDKIPANFTMCMFMKSAYFVGGLILIMILLIVHSTYELKDLWKFYEEQTELNNQEIEKHNMDNEIRNKPRDSPIVSTLNHQGITTCDQQKPKKERKKGKQLRRRQNATEND